jgi:hypothetical protein
MKEWISSKFKPWKAGDKVWLESRNLNFNYPSRKLAPKQEGPFTIVKVLSPISYQLKIPITWKIHDVFHASFLSPYRETPEHGPNFLQPPPVITNSEEQWEVEKIISH